MISYLRSCYLDSCTINKIRNFRHIDYIYFDYCYLTYFDHQCMSEKPKYLKRLCIQIHNRPTVTQARGLKLFYCTGNPGFRDWDFESHSRDCFVRCPIILPSTRWPFATTSIKSTEVRYRQYEIRDNLVHYSCAFVNVKPH